jgi:hypothetical protein
MNIDQQNDIFEYEWWRVFVGYIFLFILSVTLIGALYFGAQVTDDHETLFRFIFIGFLGGMGLLFSIGGIWTIHSVPKHIIFKQNSINVVFPFGKEKAFLYEDISRIIILRGITERKHLLDTSWSPFRVRIYFSDNVSKVFINSDRLVNYPALLDSLKNKGLGSKIAQK